MRLGWAIVAGVLLMLALGPIILLDFSAGTFTTYETKDWERGEPRWLAYPSWERQNGLFLNRVVSGDTFDLIVVFRTARCPLEEEVRLRVDGQAVPGPIVYRCDRGDRDLVYLEAKSVTLARDGHLVEVGGLDCADIAYGDCRLGDRLYGDRTERFYSSYLEALSGV